MTVRAVGASVVLSMSVRFKMVAPSALIVAFCATAFATGFFTVYAVLALCRLEAPDLARIQTASIDIPLTRPALEGAQFVPIRLDPSATQWFLRGGKGPRADLASGAPDAIIPSASLVMLARALQDERQAPGLLQISLSQTRSSASRFLLTNPLEETAGRPMPSARPQFTGLDANAGRFAEHGMAGRDFFGGLTESEFREREQRCLATAVYFEARGESVQGQYAVAQTIMNRVRSHVFPETICGVVYQGSDREAVCQFSFACDGLSDNPHLGMEWELATDVAQRTVDGEVWLDNVGDATHYHATSVQPDWAPLLERKIRIGRHVFYRMPLAPVVAAAAADVEVDVSDARAPGSIE